jgi:hypothetical protein
MKLIRILILAVPVACTASDPPAPPRSEREENAVIRVADLQDLLSSWEKTHGAPWTPASETNLTFKPDTVLISDLLADVDARDAAATQYRREVEAFVRALSEGDRKSLKAAFLELLARMTANAELNIPFEDRDPTAIVPYLYVPEIRDGFFPKFASSHYIEARRSGTGTLAFEVAEYSVGEGVSPPAFPTAALNEFYRDGARMNFVLTRDVLFCRRKTGDVFLVPAGFITDFASVPGAARRLLPQIAHEAGPALLHDWLYAISSARSKKHQAFADTVFVEELIDAEAGRVRSTMFSTAVRLGGLPAVGNPAELRFATPLTAEIGARYVGAPANAIVARIDCDDFALRYFQLLRDYGTGEAIDIYEIYENAEFREHIRSVLGG